MTFLDFLKEETASGDIATVDQRFPETKNSKNDLEELMIKRKIENPIDNPDEDSD